MDGFLVALALIILASVIYALTKRQSHTTTTVPSSTTTSPATTPASTPSSSTPTPSSSTSTPTPSSTSLATLPPVTPAPTAFAYTNTVVRFGTSSITFQSANGVYQCTLGTDGTMSIRNVLTHPSQLVWTTPAPFSSPAPFRLNVNSNGYLLAITDNQYAVVWAAPTTNQPGPSLPQAVSLYLNTAGHLTLQDAQQHVLWQSP